MPTRTELEIRRAHTVLLWAMLCLLGAGLAGCGGTFGGDSKIIGDLERGMRAYEKGHYADAILHFERFQETQPGSRFMDKALFYLGKSHQGQREFLLASDSFRQILQDYPQSELLEEAAFEVAMSAYRSARKYPYGPAAIFDAIDGFRQYLRRFPEGAYVAESNEAMKDLEGRLSMKACKNGETYMKLGKYEAAQYYFEKGLAFRDDIDTIPSCLLGLGSSLEKQNDYQGAQDAYRRLEAWLEGDGAGVLEAEKIAELLERARARIRSLAGRATQDSSSIPLSGGTD